jgi:uridine kinase
MDPLELAKVMATELESFGRTRPVTMAVDGPVGSGTAVLADRVATVCRSWGRSVFRISGDDFLHPRRIRDRRGNDSPEGYLEDTLDDAALRRLVLEPLARGDRRVVRRIHDAELDAPVDSPTEVVPDDALVIVDGSFLLRSSLRSLWDLGVLLDVAETERIRPRGRSDRMIGAGPTGAASEEALRQARGYALYLEREDPAGKADIVIDNSDGRRPVPIRWP